MDRHTRTLSNGGTTHTAEQTKGHGPYLHPYKPICHNQSEEWVDHPKKPVCHNRNANWQEDQEITHNNHHVLITALPYDQHAGLLPQLSTVPTEAKHISVRTMIPKPPWLVH